MIIKDVQPGELKAAVVAAIQEMTWLEDADQAQVDLCINYAAAIDDGVANGKADKVMYLGPHLQKALEALGGTPASRKAIKSGADGDDKGGTLRQMRDAARERRRSA